MKKQLLVFGIFLTFLSACVSEGENVAGVQAGFNYRNFIKKFHRHTDKELLHDTLNVLEQHELNPFRDSLSTVLQKMEEAWERDSLALLNYNTFNTILQADSLGLQAILRDAYDSTTERALETSALPVAEDVEHLKFNLESIRSLNKNTNTAPGCQNAHCRVWALVNKSRQRLFLFVDGQLVDSFKVSTGDAKHETPNMSVRAAGPIFKKYTSKKFPGGDYMGLGNMPYAVFFKGGFAIHGTTPGNFSKLGKPASHGCIRLHPDDAVIFNELVRTVGLSETWVTVE